MDEFEKLLKEEEEKVERIVGQVNERLKNAPEGRLQLSKNKESTQFYIYNNKNKSRRYLSKENEELICRLAQKSYDEKVIRSAEKRLNLIKKVNKHYEINELEQLYLKEHSERQKRICPVEISWEKKLEKWNDETYDGKEFQEGMPVILTAKGERVRSKSEKILADFFYNTGISYKYEKPLYLKGMGVVYPDFTFLSPKTGREIYWEHAGRMDDPVYAESAIRKIQVYENNNIFPGERLILTFETAKNILDVRLVSKLVERYILG